MLDVCSSCCFLTFVLEVHVLAVFPLFVEVELFHVFVELLLCSKSLLFGIFIVLFHLCVLDVFVWRDTHVMWHTWCRCLPDCCVK